MTTARKIGAGFAIVGLIGSVAVAVTYAVSLDDGQDAGAGEVPFTQFADATGVTVTPGRLVLPSQADKPASIQFSVTNHAPTQIYIRGRGCSTDPRHRWWIWAGS